MSLKPLSSSQENHRITEDIPSKPVTRSGRFCFCASSASALAVGAVALIIIGVVSGGLSGLIMLSVGSGVLGIVTIATITALVKKLCSHQKTSLQASSQREAPAGPITSGRRTIFLQNHPMLIEETKPLEHYNNMGYYDANRKIYFSYYVSDTLKIGVYLNINQERAEEKYLMYVPSKKQSCKIYLISEQEASTYKQAEDPIKT